jgi:hypothetical protein
LYSLSYKQLFNPPFLFSSIRRIKGGIILNKMKNVKLSLANIQGKLSRTEMKNLNGGKAPGGGGDDGTSSCWITTYGAHYSNPNTNLIFVSSGCPSASSEAEAYCNDLISTTDNGVYHCKFNCGC